MVKSLAQGVATHHPYPSCLVISCVAMRRVIVLTSSTSRSRGRRFFQCPNQQVMLMSLNFYFMLFLVKISKEQFLFFLLFFSRDLQSTTFFIGWKMSWSLMLENQMSLLLEMLVMKLMQVWFKIQKYKRGRLSNLRISSKKREIQGLFCFFFFLIGSLLLMFIGVP